jgi:predicted aspartyl protease
VLDLTEQDFKYISNVTGRLFEMRVHRSDGHLYTVACPNSKFLKQDLKGKHSWLNASSAKDLSERVRHVLSACATNSLSTSVCFLTRQSMPIDMSLLKDFRCVLTVPKGGLVRQQQEDGSWLVVQSFERLRVLYRSTAVDRVSAKTRLLTSKIISCAVAKGSPDAQKKKRTRMMFSGRAAAAKANILFDTGASANFVSKTFAKQTGITVRPLEYSVCLADDKTTEVAGEATVYVQLGAFHKPVKCYVMDMLYKVDLILGEDKYDCILHYGKGCIMIRKGKRHVTINSHALPRNQLPVDDEKSDSVLSFS